MTEEKYSFVIVMSTKKQMLW